MKEVEFDRICTVQPGNGSTVCGFTRCHKATAPRKRETHRIHDFPTRGFPKSTVYPHLHKFTSPGTQGLQEIRVHELSKLSDDFHWPNCTFPVTDRDFHWSDRTCPKSFTTPSVRVHTFQKIIEQSRQVRRYIYPESPDPRPEFSIPPILSHPTFPHLIHTVHPRHGDTKTR